MYAAAVAGIVREQFFVLVGLIAAIAMVGLLRRQWQYWSRPVPVRAEGGSPLADNSAAALVEARSAIEKAWLGVIEWGPDWAHREDLRGNCERLGEIAMDLTFRHTRLRVTFGPEDDATASFGAAVDSVERIYSGLRSIRGSNDPDPSRRQEANDQARLSFAAICSEIDSERKHFLAASSRFEATVGGRVGASST